MGSRVYEYGLVKNELTDEKKIHEQIYLAHQYYNKLIEIERERREAIRAAQDTFPNIKVLKESLEKANEEIDLLFEQIQKVKKAARSAEVSNEAKEKMKALRAKRKETYEALKAEKQKEKNDPSLIALYEEAEGNARAKRKMARAACNVYWGTYLLIEESVDRVRQTSKEEARFKRFTRNGRISVQIQGGMKAEEIFAPNTLIVIDPVNPLAWEKTTRRGDRRRLARVPMKMRIGTDGRAPIWVHFRATIHRPLPKDAEVKRATVVVRHTAHGYVYRLQLTINEPDRPKVKRPGIIGVDVGWREIDGTLRVAFGVDDQKNEVELRLNTGWLNPKKPVSPVVYDVSKADSIRGFRDKALDAIKAELASGKSFHLSSELLSQFENMHAWRSPARFQTLYNLWKKRFDAGEDVTDEERLLFSKLDLFLSRDLHLWQYESGLRNQALGYRKNLYRNFAAKLARTYGTVVLEKFDMREVARRDAPDKGTKDPRAPNRNRVLASVSELRMCIKNAVEREGGTYLEVPSQNTTRACAYCGSIEDFDQAAKLVHTCGACQKNWDQDANAARNLLSLGAKHEKEVKMEAVKEKKTKWKPRQKEPGVETGGLVG